MPWFVSFLNAVIPSALITFIWFPPDLQFRKHSKLSSPTDCVRFSSSKDDWLTVNMVYDFANQRAIYWSPSHTPGWLHLTTMEKHLVLLDISHVWHECFLPKLLTFAFSPSLVPWTSSFQSKRTISIRVDRVLFEPLPGNIGVPPRFSVYSQSLPLIWNWPPVRYL